jgi:putative transferase (TIGR04331 family)
LSAISYTLVTTALKETWPEDRPILFLGKWCVPYNDRYSIKHMEYAIHPYHWDDKEKQHKDCIYLDKIYEKLICQISVKMNHIHQVSYSDRYWEILLGKWLRTFIHITFDRWTSLTSVFDNYKLCDVYAIDRMLDPSNMGNSMMNANTDSWNEAFFIDLIRLFFEDRVNIKIQQKVDINNKNINYSTNNAKKNKLSFYCLSRRKFVQFFSYISGYFISNNDILFYRPHLPLSVQFRIQIKLKQLPHIAIPIFNNYQYKESDVKSNYRDWKDILVDENDDFMQILLKMVPRYIPNSYVELYQNFSDNCQPKNLPKHPKVIITGGSFYKNTLESFWLAKNVEYGSKILILQHGGGYRTIREHSAEKYERRIADYFLSWGCCNKADQNMINTGYLRMFNKQIKSRKFNKAILVGVNMPRYSTTRHGVINTSWTEYFNNQVIFFRALPKEIRNNTLIRIYRGTYQGRCQKDRWIDNFPNINFADNSKSLIDFMENGYMNICTYNATTYLESLTLNVPTIIYWTGGGISDQAIPYFKLLGSVGIFFEDPIDAAKHLESIWGNIEGWWESEDVQNVRNIFCKQYCYLSDEILDNSISILKNIDVT